MPPSKYLLYLDGNEVADALEAMRRVCQPNSSSLPHITVRYSKRELSEAALSHYADAAVEDIILVEPATFDRAGEFEPIRTVVILCESESLEWLSYKPDFPGSVFHITIYDGEPSLFATQALAVLREYSWNLRLRPGYSKSAPFARPAVKPVQDAEGIAITPGARALLTQVMERLGVGSSLHALSDESRLLILRDLIRRVQQSDVVEDAGDYPVAIDSVDSELFSSSDFAGQAAFWTSSELNELSGRESAPPLKETASFLTPPELAFDIAKALWSARNSNLPVRFGDPAVGPGVFFAALRRASHGEVMQSATGVEINPVRAGTTVRRWRRAGMRVITDDFLKARPPADGWTLLAANPPYLRSQSLPPSIVDIRKHLAAELDLNVSGRSDLYVYFVLKAHSWLSTGAVAGWLLPTEFQVTDYGKALRDYLSHRVRVLRIHEYDQTVGQFENARISSTVVLYQKSIAQDEDVAVVTQGGTLAEPESSRLVEHRELRTARRWSFSVPHSRPAAEIVRVGDLFAIKRGIATGANGIFVLSASQMAAFGWPRQYTRPLLPRSRSMSSTTVLSDQLGEPIVDLPRWLIDTDASIDAIAADSPDFADYLRRAKVAVGDRTLVRQRVPIYRQERRDPPDIAFVYMAQAEARVARRFFLNRSAAVVLNSYLGLSVKPHFKNILGLDGLTDLHRCLSGVDPAELKMRGRMYTNGLLKLEPKELAQVELPSSELSADVVAAVRHIQGV